MTKRKIERAIRDLEAEKKEAEEKLEKFNSMNLMAKNHDKDEGEIVAELKELT